MGLFGSAQDQVDLSGLTERITKLESAVASLQSQIVALTTGAVAANGGVPYAGEPGSLAAAGEWMAEVRALKANGQLINAIKVYRQHTLVGLKEAKDAVEGMP
jgi:ribosomal protein L7/L12